MVTNACRKGCGIIRDIFSMGARPIAILDSLRFGPIDNGKTRHIVDQVTAGIAGYGTVLEFRRLVAK